MRFVAALAIGLGATQALAYNQPGYAGIQVRQDDESTTTTTTDATTTTDPVDDATTTSDPVDDPTTTTDPVDDPTSAPPTTSVDDPEPTDDVEGGRGGPIQIGDFKYVGCVGDRDRFPGWYLAETSTAMTREICASKCNKKTRFFGVAGPDCYCGDKADMAQIVGDRQCNVPCPGNRRDTCGGGGSIRPEGEGERGVESRQLPIIILLSVYVNIFFDGGAVTVTDVSTATITQTVTDSVGSVYTTTATTTVYPHHGPCYGPWCPKPLPTPGPKYPCHGDACFKKIVCYGDWCDFDYPCLGDWCKTRIVCWDDVCRPEPCKDGLCHKKVCCKGDTCKYDTCKGDECNKKVVCYGDHCEFEKCHGDHCKKNWVCKGDHCKHEPCKDGKCWEKIVCEGEHCKPEPPCKDCKPVVPVKPVEPVKPVYPVDEKKTYKEGEHVVVAGAEKAIASFAVLAFAGAAMFL